MRRNIDVPIFQVNRKIYAHLYKNPDMKFGERLRQARKAAKLTQVELGRRVGLTQAAISDLESGNTAGTAQLLPLAKALGVAPEWLLNTTGPRVIVTTPEEDHASVRELLELLRRATSTGARVAFEAESKIPDITDGMTKLLQAVVDAYEAGLTDEEMLPIRLTLEALTRVKRTSLASVPSIEAAAENAESSLDQNVTEALRGALPSRGVGPSIDEQARRGHKRKSS
ncbi:hypothetical protein BN2476_350262 [Paraburkholderia piptadeniae]|uniref:HTH cro/C1-type domain-containing protein n=1 Tax=Paraburkholderia piptadeniae TaxID=1701573 RepID=A0A1N7S8T0_9BURK|nr:helix-turn-helix transcriptional regulator [Paraburkholderia piptadeniae]SIT43731.1 hypothetical protein BN2476_350262 [Paraburkholderia piptadeniae]